MAKRKPPGIGWESFVDRQIREAEERGDFDNLPGAGKPIPGSGQPYDKDWWLKSYLQRENLSALPDTLRIEKFIEDEKKRITPLRAEIAVREQLEELNRFLRDEIARATSGPSSRATLVDIDKFVAAWRADQDARES